MKTVSYTHLDVYKRQIYLTTDMNAQPTAWGEAETAALRARLQQQQTGPTHQYDFVVVGGGVAGMCAATAAARLGCSVALVNDRPVPVSYTHLDVYKRQA